MYVAEQLGKFEHEVLALPVHSFARWIAYFNIKAKEEKRSIDKSRRNAKLKSYQPAG
jgi:hypothetical protein